MKTVYLAGPITGLTYQGCTDWREEMIRQLAQHQIKGLSPMRMKAYLEQYGIMKADARPEYEAAGLFSSQRAIVTRDHYDCTHCDVLLVNLLGAKTVSIGTMFEVAWAWMKRTPIVLMIEQTGNVHEHMFVNETYGFRVTNMDDAVAAIVGILA